VCQRINVGFENEYPPTNFKDKCFFCNKGKDEIRNLYDITVSDGTVYQFHEDCLHDTLKVKNGLKGVDVALLILAAMKRQEESNDGLIEVELELSDDILMKLTLYAHELDITLNQAITKILKEQLIKFKETES
jgi:hypothetical protein